MPCNAVMAADGTEHKPLIDSRNFQPMRLCTHRTTLAIGMRNKHSAAVAFLICLAGWQENLHAIG